MIDNNGLFSEGLSYDDGVIGCVDNGNDVLITEPPPTKKMLIDTEAGPSTIETPKVFRSCVIDMRLPNPCPLPTNFSSQSTAAIKNNQLMGLSKFRFLRECAEYYFGICPKPTPNEYIRMAQMLCDTFPQLKDKDDGEHWVSVCYFIMCQLINVI